jgi:kynureninase
VSLDRARFEALDAADPLAHLRGRFRLDDDRIYLDGNSLGVPPASALAALRTAAETEWAEGLIGSWNDADWIGLPERLGDRIGALIGAAPGQTVVADSTSVNLFKTLVAALALRPGRRTIVSTAENFPTDLYMVEGLAELLGAARCRLRTIPAEALDDLDAHLDALPEQDVAAVLLTHVDFRSGRRHDLAAITRTVQARGALVLWDLAHSAGAMPLDLDAAGVDLAVGCGYKYLCGGPGAPAFLYVAARHQAAARQPLTGWMGHARPFAFEPGYAAGEGARRFLCGTPPILSMRALEGALDAFEGVDLHALRARSEALTDAFVEAVEASAVGDAFELASPRTARDRGSQVSLRHPEAYALVRALIEADVVGDFREPDLLRFGFSPLYTRFVDVHDAVARLEVVVLEGRHRDPRHAARSRVT